MKDLVPTSTWAVMATDPSRYSAVYQELFGGTLTRNSLTVIQVPAGGGKAWQVQTLEGIKSVETLEGVILALRLSRVYYNAVFGSGEKRPPSCFSPDGIRGQGSPGGACSLCPMDEWGSARKHISASMDENSKACKERVHIYFWIPDRRLPCLVDGPTMSTKALKEYRRLLYEAGIEPYEVLTSLSLNVTRNKGGINYSEIRPRISRQLTPEEKAVTTAMAQGLESFIPSSHSFAPTDSWEDAKPFEEVIS